MIITKHMLFIWFFRAIASFVRKVTPAMTGFSFFQSLQVRETKRYFCMLSGIWSKFLCRIFVPIGQLVRLFDSLSISVWTVCLPVHQFVCRLSVFFVRLPVCLSVCLSLSVCPSMWSVCLSISHSVYRSVSRGLVSSMVSQVRSRASSDINSVCNIATTLNRPVGFFDVTVIAYVFERL